MWVPMLRSLRAQISLRSLALLFLSLFLGLALLVTAALKSAPVWADPQVRMRTDFGDFFINMTPENAPLTVENFLAYVNSGAYDDSFFHRNPSGGGFVLQGGEFFWPQGAANPLNIPEIAPVMNEFNVSNTRGTVALAKLAGDPNSGTNNFFVNLADNGANLDNQNGGFTVFGTINAAGMEVIDTIAALRTANEVPILEPFVDVTSREAVLLITSAEEFAAVGAPAAAILPASRSVGVGEEATGFATIINTSDSEAASCTMAPATELAADFFYRRTNPTNNQPFGPNNPQIDIDAGSSVSLIFSFTPSAAISPTTVEFEYTCGNASAAAALTTGVNTFDLAASTTPSADVVALAGTASNDGINNIPNSVGSGAFVVATFNLGAEEEITVAADTGSASLPLDLFVCPTDAESGDCLPGQAPALSASATLATNQASTFAVFAQLRNAADSVGFDPANNRAFVRFTNATGELRGSTSVALRTTP